MGFINKVMKIIKKFLSSSIKFNGTSGYFNYAGSSSFDFGTDDFTVDFWVRSNGSWPTYATILASENYWTVGSNGNWTINIQSGLLGIASYDGQASYESSRITSALSTDTWHHAAIVRDSGSISVYIDGQHKVSAAGNKSLTDGANGLVVGKMNLVGTPYYFNGWLDELRITKGTALWTGTESFSVPTRNYTGTYSPYISKLSFEEGDEDLDIDITDLVESWIAATTPNHGIMVRLSGSFESGTESFYTKKFSARNSEYFFNRPVIEARWDSSEKDDRNNFYAKSNLRSAADNQNVIAIKNYVDGVLTNIPSVDTAMTVKFYTDSTKTTEITPDSNTMDNTTAGVYKATVVLDTALSSVYVVWQDAAPVVFNTETIEVKQRSVAAANIPEYVTTIQNLKKVYSNDEMARFRLFIRSKDWSPTIYTVATTELKSEVVADAYYKIMRVVDDFTVIDYGSGSDKHTKLSYDENGPYFDFDMSMLETGWAYRIEFMYKINGEMRQQPEAFKFRVVE